jgi:hypothetical protein
MQLISLVYTNRPLAFNEMGRFKKYIFYSDAKGLVKGDMIISPMYNTPLQVYKTELDSKEVVGYDPKYLVIDKIIKKSTGDIIQNILSEREFIINHTTEIIEEKDSHWIPLNF